MAVSTVLALVLSWTALGRQLDLQAYDFLFRLETPAPWQPDSIILAIDEATLSRYGGLTGMRTALAVGLEKIAPAHPAAVAVDLILADDPNNPANPRLEAAFADTKNLVLSADLLPDSSGWEDPLSQFRIHAVAVGEVHADLDRFDAISRDLPLQEVAVHDRRWALALDAWLAVEHLDITESPDELVAGSTVIPSRQSGGRTLRIRYAPNGIPRVSIAQLDRDPSLASRFAGKVVFAGVTAQTASDRWMTPYSDSRAMPGVEFHANLYETLARRMFLVDAPLSAVTLGCFALAALIGIAFLFTGPWQTNTGAILVVIASQLIPAIAFRHSAVWPWMPGTLTSLFAIATAIAWRHLIVRRQLITAQSEKDRYQRSMQFAIHELRTPLTAIQGSSELISRYGSMPEIKRKEMADLINAESKRLARMIETFLSVERLSAGQLEMKQERFALGDLVHRCATRAQPLADAKKIALDLDDFDATQITGDRELMEYAVYNLMTNAIKYSPSGTRVIVFADDNNRDGRVRLAVQDQGIGMDKKEVSRIFERFYRTRRAEQTGEAGTGIGLSIVEQIVVQHGGSIQVESEPGKGSRFTLVLKRAD
jgi:signal transduction histidine kinase